MNVPSILQSYRINRHSLGYPLSALLSQTREGTIGGTNTNSGTNAVSRFQNLVIPAGLVMQADIRSATEDTRHIPTEDLTGLQRNMETVRGIREDSDTDTETKEDDTDECIDPILYDRMVESVNSVSKLKPTRRTRKIRPV